MGILGGKIVQVASAVYNMAGDEKDRPIYLQNLILRNILSGTKKGLGETIPVGYLQGPGIKYRNFFKWALRNYDLVGMPTGSMQAGDLVSTSSVQPEIPHDPGETVWVQDAFLGSSDYQKWAEQWMLRNHPDDYQTDWEASFDKSTKRITIVMEDTTEYSFIASTFNAKAKYIYAYYTKSTQGNSDPVVVGTSHSLAPGAPFPSVTGYSLTSDTTVSRTETLDESVVVVDTFSDGRPNEGSTSSTSNPVSVDRQTRIYERVVVVGNDPDSDGKISRRDIRRLISDKAVDVVVDVDVTETDIGGGVTRTRTTTTTTEVLIDNNSYRDDTQKIYEYAWQPLDLFIYRIGSGNSVLDALVRSIADYGQFYPFIPVRLKNEFLDENPDYDDLLEISKKAYNRATDGGRYTKLVEQLADNEDIEDMDYIYVIFGVSLNTLDNSARKYIYEFFHRLMTDQVGDEFTEGSYAELVEEYNDAYAIWKLWRDSDTAYPGSEPYVPPKPVLPTNEIKIASQDTSDDFDLNFDIRLSWNYIVEKTGTGKGKTGATKNDVWLEFRGTTFYEDPVYTGPSRPDNDWQQRPKSYDTIRIWWQHEDNAYKYLDVTGLEHRNYIYDGEHVLITAKQALDDGEESAFVVPLHYATQRAMRLVDSTQMGTACVFLMINVYEIHKKKWWQSGFFAIILVVVVAVVSVVFTGGAGFGLLGSHLSVGASMGLTGLTAAIVGSVANALAAMLLTTILTKLTEKLGILGSILSAVIGILVSGFMTSLQNGTAFSFNFADLMKADNLLKLTNSLGNGYVSYVKGSIMDMQNDLIKIQENANNELNRIRESYLEQFGYGGGQIDPMMFVGDSPVIAESRETFLARTLMSGTDIAQMSQDMLSNFAELNLTLPNAFT